MSNYKITDYSYKQAERYGFEIKQSSNKKDMMKYMSNGYLSGILLW